MTANFKRQKRERKPLILNFMLLSSLGHLNPSVWAHPNDKSRDYKKISYWTGVAKLAEKVKFNSIFIADVLGPYDVYKGPHNFDAVARSGAQFPLIDPSAYISAMVGATETVSFGITFSTISEAPYLFARRLATLDHLSNGRVGWNIVTSYLQSAARNLLDSKSLPPHDKRYEKAEEYLDVVYKLLLSSWRDDAVVDDRENLTYAEPSRIREINHKGEFFDVPGPFVSEPSPQRMPVILQAGASKTGREFAAQHAEIVFIQGFTPEALKASIDEIREIAVQKFERKPDHIRFISELIIILGETSEEAEAKFQDLMKYHDAEGKQALIGGWTGLDLSQFEQDEDLESIDSNAMLSAVKMYITDNKKKTRAEVAQSVGLGHGRKRVLIGTAKEVADEIERIVDISGIDGFNFANANFPATFEDIAELLAPELRGRGLLWDEYPVPGGTFRENLYGVKGQRFVPKDHKAYTYRWREGSREEFAKSFNTE